MSDESPATNSVAPSALRKLLYQAALPAMPCGFACWLLGMAAESYLAAALGLSLLIGGAFLWQDDQSPAHPGS